MSPYLGQNFDPASCQGAKTSDHVFADCDILRVRGVPVSNPCDGRWPLGDAARRFVVERETTKQIPPAPYADGLRTHIDSVVGVSS